MNTKVFYSRRIHKLRTPSPPDYDVNARTGQIWFSLQPPAAYIDTAVYLTIHPTDTYSSIPIAQLESNIVLRRLILNPFPSSHGVYYIVIP